MARIGSQGLVDDGSSNLTVAGSVAAGGGASVAYVAPVAATLDGTGLTTISQPGFYFVAASGSGGVGVFTGSVPSPGLFPGSQLTIVDTLGTNPWLLSGSAYRNGKALFVKASGSVPGVAGGSGYGGGTVLMSASGSIIMSSDGFRWCILGGSGSCALAGNNL